MNIRLAIAAVLAFNVAAAFPVRATDCSTLRERYQEYLSDRDVLVKEMRRVQERNRGKPLDKKFDPDHVYCIALRQVMDDILLLSITDTTGCFVSEIDATNYKEDLDKIGHAAASESGFYCSQTDLQAPLRDRMRDLK